MKALATGAAAMLRATGRVVVSAKTWFLLLALAGLGALLTGVFLLAGGAWALVAGGIVGLLGALLILVGMTRNG